MDDVIDLYDDLDDFHEDEQNKAKELQEAENKNHELSKIIEDLKLQLETKDKEIKKMEKNFRVLLATSVAESKRKDQMINDLRVKMDDMCFRRRKFPNKPANHEEFIDADHEEIPFKVNAEQNIPKNLNNEMERFGGNQRTNPFKVNAQQNIEMPMNTNYQNVPQSQFPLNNNNCAYMNTKISDHMNPMYEQRQMSAPHIANQYGSFDNRNPLLDRRNNHQKDTVFRDLSRGLSSGRTLYNDSPVTVVSQEQEKEDLSVAQSHDRHANDQPVKNSHNHKKDHNGRKGDDRNGPSGHHNRNEGVRGKDNHRSETHDYERNRSKSKHRHHTADHENQRSESKDPSHPTDHGSHTSKSKDRPHHESQTCESKVPSHTTDHGTQKSKSKDPSHPTDRGSQRSKSKDRPHTADHASQRSKSKDRPHTTDHGSQRTISKDPSTDRGSQRSESKDPSYITDRGIQRSKSKDPSHPTDRGIQRSKSKERSRNRSKSRDRSHTADHSSTTKSRERSHRTDHESKSNERLHSNDHTSKTDKNSKSSHRSNSKDRNRSKSTDHSTKKEDVDNKHRTDKERQERNHKDDKHREVNTNQENPIKDKAANNTDTIMEIGKDADGNVLIDPRIAWLAKRQNQNSDADKLIVVLYDTTPPTFEPQQRPHQIGIQEMAQSFGHAIRRISCEEDRTPQSEINTNISTIPAVTTLLTPTKMQVYNDLIAQPKLLSNVMQLIGRQTAVSIDENKKKPIENIEKTVQQEKENVNEVEELKKTIGETVERKISEPIEIIDDSDEENDKIPIIIEHCEGNEDEESQGNEKVIKDNIMNMSMPNLDEIVEETQTEVLKEPIHQTPVVEESFDNKGHKIDANVVDDAMEPPEIVHISNESQVVTEEDNVKDVKSSPIPEKEENKESFVVREENLKGDNKIDSVECSESLKEGSSQENPKEKTTTEDHEATKVKEIAKEEENKTAEKTTELKSSEQKKDEDKISTESISESSKEQKENQVELGTSETAQTAEEFNDTVKEIAKTTNTKKRRLMDLDNNEKDSDCDTRPLKNIKKMRQTTTEPPKKPEPEPENAETPRRTEEKFNEIDRELSEMFKSPVVACAKRKSQIRSMMSEENATDTQEILNDTTQTTGDVPTENVTIDETVDTLASTSMSTTLNESKNTSGEIKHMTLGSKDYTFEKIDEHVVKLVITRKRGKKRAAPPPEQKKTT